MERIREAIKHRRQPSVSYEPLHGDDHSIPHHEALSKFSWLDYTIFSLLGVSMLWAWGSFLAAFPYFAYRFESSEWLVSHFPSAITSVSTFTNLASIGLLTCLQAGASYPSRITVSLIINIVTFTLLALSTVLFRQVSAGIYFGFLMVIVAAASLACGFSQNGVFAYASGFGIGEYTQGVMTGQAVAGVLPCIAQIVLVYSVPDDTAARENAGQESPRSAFAFFLTAAGVSAIALAASLLVLFRRHGERAGEGKVKDALNGEAENEVVERRIVSPWLLFRKLRWLALAVLLDFGITMLVFPVFTQKIQSVRATANAPRLFQPVCFVPLAFLFWNAGDLVGRLSTLVPSLAASVERPRAIFTLAVLRVGFIPLYLLCNIDGRGATVHSDTFYLLIVQFLFGLTNGFVGSICMMGASHWVEADEGEAAGGFMSFMLVGGLTVGSLLSFLI